MPALNFAARFAPLVESGQKRQTLRARRRDGRDPKAGQTLHLYAGMRTQGCRKLRQVLCKAVRPVRVSRGGDILVAGELLALSAGEAFARADGFTDVAELVDWFDRVHGLPFEGCLIQW
ncbi:MAG: ASCH domain-containing protein [Thermodesulfobacteriota bacterium]